MSKRRFWFTVMVALGMFDLCLATWIAGEWAISKLTSSPVSIPSTTVAAIATPTPEPTLEEAPEVEEPEAPLPAVPLPTTTATRRPATPTSTRTPTRRPAPSATPTRRPAVLVPTPTRPVRPVTATNPPPPPGPAAPARTVSLVLPDDLNHEPLNVLIPPEPLQCTPAARVPAVITRSLRLCPDETYGTLNVNGEGVGIFGDDARSAVIRVQGRSFGIVLEGRRNVVVGVTIRATGDPADLNTLLCLYPTCRKENKGLVVSGGINYGAGILVRASESAVLDSDVSGGLSGISASNVRGLIVARNKLDRMTGWGAYGHLVTESYYVGNSFNDNNRSCIDYDGNLHPTGCESAGWVCIDCHHNIIADNTCTNSGDCYYLNGEGQQGSHYNRFYNNICRAAPHNCFEVTFAQGNEFVGNTAAADRNTGKECLYPFWIGGSRVIFGKNTWACTIGVERALRDAQNSTDVPTSIEYKSGG